MDDSVPIILIPNQTELKEIDPKQTCRLCLMSNEPDNLFDFYSSNNIIRQDISMVSLLSDCFKIEFHEDKDLPDRVCTNCATSILVVHAFRGNVLKCQELLNKHLDAVQQRKANIQVNPLEVENNHLDVVQQQEANIQLNLLEDEIYNDLQSEPEKDIPLLQVKSVHMLFDNGRESAKLCLPAALVDHDYLKPTVVVEPKVEWWSRKRKPPYICKICGTNYGVRYKSFYSHVRNHTGIKMPCEYCGKRFLRDNLRGHLRTHTNEKPFLCTQCPARFRIPRAFKDHMKVHTGEKSYMCEICGKAYIQSSSLSIHKFNKHGSKSSKSETPRRKKCEKQWPYYCEQCNKGFKSVIGLKCHLRLKSDTFCKSCCKDFSSTFNLRVHKLWHEIKLKESNISYFQKWICDICKMECNEAESLANHIITHMENWKIFNCANCDKNFTSKLSYNLHVKSHKGCRPYTCDICSNSFVLPGHLKRHLVIHAADKPHKCKICFKGFNQKSNLLSHMSTHGYTWLPE